MSEKKLNTQINSHVRMNEMCEQAETVIKIPIIGFHGIKKLMWICHLNDRDWEHYWRDLLAITKLWLRH